MDIVRNTLEHYRKAGPAHSDKIFYQLIAEYPDIVCDYCIVTAAGDLAEAAAVFP